MGDVSYHVITEVDQFQHKDKVPIGKKVVTQVTVPNLPLGF